MLRPLLRVLTPSSTPVERWWWASELRSSPTETRSGTTACWTRSRGIGPLPWLGRWSRAEEVSIVASAFLWRAEDCVCFADSYEALGGVRVIGVEVRVVGFGEGVELFLYFCCGGVGGKLEGFVVVWWAVVIVGSRGGVEVSNRAIEGEGVLLRAEVLRR
jgi:hypothetical protein